ncbi:MAG: hypothetical protein ACJARD_001065 [Alphaproteobacteria bacterium]|jgi:hypothetical protein
MGISNNEAEFQDHQQNNIAFESAQDITNDLALKIQALKATRHRNAVKKNYLYQRAAMRVKHELLQSNNHYAHTNRQPPKAPIKLSKYSKPDNLLQQNIFPFHRSKHNIGQEKSVKLHHYDDNAPMVASAHDFKTLYTPKTVKYMWTANDLDYDVAMALKSDLQSYLDLTNQQRTQYMQTIMEVRFVEQSDTQNEACDHELIGQNGVFASHDIPAMSVVGVYAGIFLKDADDMLTLAKKIPLEYFQDYLFRIPIKEKFPKVSAYQNGNRLSLVNAASNYKADKEITFNEICQRANLMLLTVKTGECTIPHIADNDETPDILFFVAGRDIPKGEQLLYDYGDVYW